MWGRYELIERVDAGPVAETWRARNAESNATVALKKLTPELAAAKDVVQRFTAEAEAMKAPPHWDLVAVLDAGQVHGEPYLARGWVDGVSLGQLLEAVRRRGIGVIPPPLALSVVRTVLQVLEKLHAAGGVHGHLVGRNVFVLGNGAVKLTDAGLTRVIETAIAGQQVIPTLWPPTEAAPEQSGADSADGVTDVYAVGALLFELLTATRPTERADDGTLIIPPASARHVPPIFTPVLGRALDERRERRYPSVAALSSELQTIAAMGFELEPSAVALAVTALMGDARMPLPPPVTELLARFALAPDLPPKARKTTGESFLIAVPTPPPLPAGTLLPPTPRPRAGDLRAVAPDEAESTVASSEPRPPTPPSTAALRTKSGEERPPTPMATAALRTKSGEERPPTPMATAALRTKSGEARPPTPMATAALRTKSGEARPPPPTAETDPSFSPGPALTAPLPASALLDPDDPKTQIDPHTLLRISAASDAASGVDVPLGDTQPGATRILPSAGAAPALGDVEPGPTRIGAAAAAPALGEEEPAPTRLRAGVALGDAEPVPTGRIEAPPTNPHAIPGRSRTRFVPLLAGLLALAATGYLVYRTVVPVPEGMVDITSTPPGADVVVNGELTEKVTPTRLVLKANQPHVIELHLPGRVNWSETVTPTAETPVVIRAELKTFPSRGNN